MALQLRGFDASMIDLSQVAFDVAAPVDCTESEADVFRCNSDNNLMPPQR